MAQISIYSYIDRGIGSEGVGSERSPWRAPWAVCRPQLLLRNAAVGENRSSRATRSESSDVAMMAMLSVANRPQERRCLGRILLGNTGIDDRTICPHSPQILIGAPNVVEGAK